MPSDWTVVMVSSCSSGYCNALGLHAWALCLITCCQLVSDFWDPSVLQLYAVHSEMHVCHCFPRDMRNALHLTSCLALSASSMRECIRDAGLTEHNAVHECLQCLM